MKLDSWYLVIIDVCLRQNISMHPHLVPKKTYSFFFQLLENLKQMENCSFHLTSHFYNEKILGFQSKSYSHYTGSSFPFPTAVSPALGFPQKFDISYLQKVLSTRLSSVKAKHIDTEESTGK